MKRALSRIPQQVDGVDYATFLGDLYISDAVALQLSVVGKAARRFTPAFKQDHPAVRWPAIIGLRNIIAHEYEKLDPARLWDVATVFAPALAKQLPDPPPLATSEEAKSESREP